MDHIIVNNGVCIPSIGYGPGGVVQGRFFRCRIHIIERVVNAVYNRLMFRKYVNNCVFALQHGYRLIDYSSAYGFEHLIGKAIKISKIPREEIIITTRVSNSDQFSGNIRNGFFQSMKKLGVSYIDLYMFHWPVTNCYLETYKEMEKLYQEGYIKILGVANCHQHHLEEILKVCNVPPAINQFEVHPLFTQKPLIKFCQDKHIAVEAYTPLARNDDRLRRNRVLQEIAEKYNKTIQQVILKWHVQNGIIPIVRSSNLKRIIDNISIFDFVLSKEEIQRIDSININSRLRYDPDNCDFTAL